MTSMVIVSVLIVVLVPLGALAAIHIGFRAPRIVERKTPADYGVDNEVIEIPTLNGQLLHGWLLPAQGRNATIIFMHGWGGNAEMILPLALPFHRAGYEVLLFDARNHGLSPDDSFSSLPKFAEDASAAVDWLRGRKADADHRVVMLGHSIGAGAVLLSASRRNDIAAVISIAAFAHPEILMRRELARLHLPDVIIRSVLAYIQWRIGHSFDEIAPMNTLCSVKCPALLVHGTSDRIVPISDMKLIIQNCGSNRAQELIIDGADHDSVERIKDHGVEIIKFLQRNGI